MSPVSEKQFFEKIRNVLEVGTHELPEEGGYGGTGGPGLLLEELLGLDKNNRDGPDSGVWEIKFHGGNSPLTLFHKTPEPKGIMQTLVRTCGWPDNKGRISFRHTIFGNSPKGFSVVNNNGRVTVKNPNYPNMEEPFWAHDTLLAAFAYKLRRLVLVQGKRSKRDSTVTYTSAQLLTEPRLTELMNLMEKGIIAIDFDARTNATGKGLRDHGTKFRIALNDLDKLYTKNQQFD